MNLLEILTTKVAEAFEEDVFGEESVKIRVIKGANDLYDVYYHTFWAHDELAIFRFLSEEAIAPLLSGLWFTSEDEGANGTQEWDLEQWVGVQQVFPNLKYLEFPMNNEQLHNKIIITYGDDFDENGGLGKLLNLMPQLEVLIAPVAPMECFFERKAHPLRELTLQVGFEHNDFIENLAEATCFAQLEKLDFTDYSEFYADDFADYCVPFEHYQKLMCSTCFPALKEIIIRNSQLSDSQQQAIQQSLLGQQTKVSFVASLANK